MVKQKTLNRQQAIKLKNLNKLNNDDQAVPKGIKSKLVLAVQGLQNKGATEANKCYKSENRQIKQGKSNFTKHKLQ